MIQKVRKLRNIYKMWFAAMIVALGTSLILTSSIISVKDKDGVQESNKAISDIASCLNETKSVKDTAIYQSLVSGVSADNYTIDVRTTRDYIVDYDNYAIKPYDIYYTYSCNGTNRYWTNIVVKNDLSRHIGKISVNENNGVYTFSNFEKKTVTVSRNPYMLYSYIEDDYIGELSQKEIKQIGDVVFQVITDTSPMIYNISSYNTKCDLTANTDNSEVYIYDNDDNVSNVEVYRVSENNYIFRVVPTYGSITNFYQQYQITFKI